MSNFELHRYDDIINLPHHVSVKHPPMSRSDRAAQFGAFSALTGHEDAIAETGRLTFKKRELTEYTMQVLNEKLKIIKDNLESLPVVRVTYFKPDELKEGGHYIEFEGRVRRIDEVAGLVIFADETQIQIDSIYNIDFKLDVLTE